jgi:type II secretory pathway component PulK
MIHRHSNQGTVLVMVVFVTALLSAVVIGLVQINTEEIQIAQNHLHTAQAMAIAEAGLNAALAQLRAKGSVGDIAETSFDQGVYWVSVSGSSLAANGRTSDGYVAKVTATVTTHAEGPPYAVDINTFKVNE